MNKIILFVIIGSVLVLASVGIFSGNIILKDPFAIPDPMVCMDGSCVPLEEYRDDWETFNGVPIEPSKCNYHYENIIQLCYYDLKLRDNSLGLCVAGNLELNGGIDKNE